jgi:hypothetical protein
MFSHTPSSSDDIISFTYPTFAFYAPAGRLAATISAATERLARHPEDKEHIYQDVFAQIEPHVDTLRRTMPPGWQAFSLYGQGAIPLGWVTYQGFPGLCAAFAAGLVLAIPDSPDRPLPITPSNCHLHGIPSDDEAIRTGNNQKGKPDRGCIAGLWSRRTKEHIDLHETGLLRMDFDDIDEVQKRRIVQHLTTCGYPLICTPSFSAREGKAKCHIFLHDDRTVPIRLIDDQYGAILRHVLGDRWYGLHDSSQGRATQLTFLTAVQRRLQEPDHAVVICGGNAAWTAGLPQEARQRDEKGALPLDWWLRQPRRPQRDTSYENDLVRASWPHPVCPALIATCDRHRLALVSCIHLAKARDMSSQQQVEFLQHLEQNIKAVKPGSMHNLAWLLRRFREDQRRHFNL